MPDLTRLALLLAVAALAPGVLPAQAPDETTMGLAATPLVTHVSPVPGGGTRTEPRVVAPLAMLDARFYGGRLRFQGMLNLEGATIPNGVLNPGAWGEGYIDKRHPHTYAHELILTGIQAAGPGRDAVSISLGKGFAPFGTDDPMSRPFVAYPVNHHLSQVLERLVAIGALRIGPVTAEAGLFNGDEPEGPGSWPNASRFGDSWSARLTLKPVPMIELQGSYADVVSPEHRNGQGLDQAKWSASGRLETMTSAGAVYGLVEWARTSEGNGAFIYHSVLAEGQLHGRVFGLAYRFERSERPEEERLLDPFRTARPLLDNSILGRSRWTIHTVHVEVVTINDWPTLRAVPFVEVSRGRVTSLSPVAFDPVAVYGKDTFWSLSAGVRLGWGMRLHRMGRYGVALPDSPALYPGPDSNHH